MNARVARSSRGIRWRAHAAWLALMLLLAMGGFTLVHNEAQRLRSTAEAANLRLVTAGAHAAAYGLRHTLDAVASMHSLASALALTQAEAGAPERRMIEALLTEVAAEERFGILQVGIVDAEGWLGWSTVPYFTPVDLTDREHVRVHREGRREVFVSEPLIGRASQRWSLNISTAILDGQGRFAGVAVVSVDPVALSASMRELQFAEGVSVKLLRDDGVTLARNANPDGDFGVSLVPTDLARINRDPVGRMITTRPAGGEPIFLAWRHMTNWPMAVTFAIDEPAAMQDSDRQGSDLYVVLSLTLAAGAILGLLLVEMRARRAERVALEATEASRAEVSRLLDAMPGAVYRSHILENGDMTRLYLSPVIARITGRPLEEFALGGSYAAIIEEEFRKDRRGFYLGIREKLHGSMEYRIHGAQGPIWVRDDCRVVSGLPDGRVEVVGLITDITAERQFKALAVSAAKLATLGEMATGLAHELNQPCAAITLAADIAALELEQGGADRLASARGRLDEIALQAIRMRGVIDHFRIFARVDNGGETAVSWPEVVAGALAISNGTMLAAGIQIEVQMPPDLPLARGSLVALEQVLVNLLINARDAMQSQAPPLRRVRINASVESDGREVLLAVRDLGGGFTAESLDRGFEPFFTTKPVGKGTGLGLSIAYGTIIGFGGSITLRNHPEGGAEVEIRLPVAASSSATLASAESH